MAVTYTWKIVALKKLDSANSIQNAIVEVDWIKTGVDEYGIEGNFEGKTKFNLSEINPETFIPFNQLTEQQIIDWIKQVVVGGYEITVNERIQQDIDSKKGTPVVLGPGQFPWQNP